MNTYIYDASGVPAHRELLEEAQHRERRDRVHSVLSSIGSTIALLAVFAIIVGGVGAIVLVTVDAIFGAEQHSVTVPACAEEDSTNCFWDAKVQGNGEGRSFLDIDGVVYYVGE